MPDNMPNNFEEELAAFMANEPPIDDPRFAPESDDGIPATESATRGRALPLVYFDDLAPMLDVRDFVQGLLLENSAVVIYGESNSGKTFLTTDIAMHVAAGLSWNGRRVAKGGVVYCVLEGGQGFHNRVWAWGKEKGVSGIPFASIPSQLNLLDPTADTARLIEAIREAGKVLSFPVKLVVIDTLSRALAGGNENAPDDMGALVMNMDRVRQETGASLLFVHHSGKDAAKGARGWSGLRAAIDTEIEVRAFEDGTKEAVLLKQRELRKGDVFKFNLAVKEVGENRFGEKVTTCVVEYGETFERDSKSVKQPKKLDGHNLRAYEVLTNLIIECGERDLAGVPPGHRAVPEQTWREAFYGATAGEQDTKRKAFVRASKDLLKFQKIGIAKSSVWIVRNELEFPLFVDGS